MKALVVSTMMLFSIVSSAEVPDFWPKQVTCQEIQEALNEYGTVLINVRYILGTDSVRVYSDKAECQAYEQERTMKVRTKDGDKCVIGKYCDAIPNP